MSVYDLKTSTDIIMSTKNIKVRVFEDGHEVEVIGKVIEGYDDPHFNDGDVVIENPNKFDGTLTLGGFGLDDHQEPKNNFIGNMLQHIIDEVEFTCAGIDLENEKYPEEDLEAINKIQEILSEREQK